MDLLIYDCFSSPCARLYSTKIIQEKRIRYDESVTYQEDLLFNLEYIKYVECAKLMDYLGYYYIEHEVSSTGRFHNKFNHIDLLQNKLLHYIRNDNDSRALKYFILQTILRKISNTFHYKSPYSKRHKIFELKQILESESFDFSQDYIDNLQINIFLKKIIKFKSSLLIYVYFQMIHKKN